jgi:hypothetical protein
MVRAPLVWLGEPDPVVTIRTNRIEDSELSEISELFELWLDFELDLDTPYTTSRLIEIACRPPVGFNEPAFERFLVRMAGDKNGGVSAKRLGEWLRRISGRVVLLEGHLAGKYRLVRGQDIDHRARFHLSKL